MESLHWTSLYSLFFLQCKVVFECNVRTQMSASPCSAFKRRDANFDVWTTPAPVPRKRHVLSHPDAICNWEETSVLFDANSLFACHAVQRKKNVIKTCSPPTVQNAIEFHPKQFPLDDHGSIEWHRLTIPQNVKSRTDQFALMSAPMRKALPQKTGFGKTGDRGRG